MEENIDKVSADESRHRESKLKTIVALTAIITASVAWTAIPLLTFNSLGMDLSIFLMLLAETLTAVLSYFFYLRKYSGFNFKLKKHPAFLRVIALSTTTILFLQGVDFLLTKLQNDFEAEATITFPTILTLLFIVPLYEEIYYRGCAIRLLQTIFDGGMFLPVVGSSIFFCLMHTQYTDFLSYVILFGSSLVLSYVRIRTNGLLYPTILHSVMNCAALILMRFA